MGNNCKGSCLANDDAIKLNPSTAIAIENLNISYKEGNDLNNSKEGNDLNKSKELSFKEQFGMIPISVPDTEENNEDLDLNLIYEELYKEITRFSEDKNQCTEEQIKLIQRVTLDNNSTYIGQIVEGIRNGYGIQYWSDGSFYSGFWSQDKASGFGKLENKAGNLYKGEWAQDSANGYGVYYYDYNNIGISGNGVDQNMYPTDSQENGESTAVTKKKTKYVLVNFEGYWKDNKPHGFGKEIWPNDAIYEGDFMEGYKYGIGKLLFPDGSCFQGSMVDGQISGQGKYNWKDGRIYNGSWKDNRIDGHGEMVWKDGRSYVGDYSNDRMNGHGVFLWADGRRYCGGWKIGKQHGFGEYTTSCGKKLKGEWYEGKRLKWFDEIGNEVNEERNDSESVN